MKLEEINFTSFESLTKLIEEHKKETYPYKRYEFDSTSYTLLLIDINKLLQENQSLKKENKILRENAEHNDKVVDKVNWENLKLKKQLEEYKRLGFEHLNDKCNQLENQQKEFIEWLENEKNIYPYDISDYTYKLLIHLCNHLSFLILCQ